MWWPGVAGYLQECAYLTKENLMVCLKSSTKGFLTLYPNCVVSCWENVVGLLASCACSSIQLTQSMALALY